MFFHTNIFSINKQRRHPATDFPTVAPRCTDYLTKVADSLHTDKFHPRKKARQANHDLPGVNYRMKSLWIATVLI